MITLSVIAYIIISLLIVRSIYKNKNGDYFDYSDLEKWGYSFLVIPFVILCALLIVAIFWLGLIALMGTLALLFWIYQNLP